MSRREDSAGWCDCNGPSNISAIGGGWYAEAAIPLNGSTLRVFAALTEALDVVDTWIKGEAHLRSLGLDYLVATGAFHIAVLGSHENAHPKFHMLFGFSAVAYQVSFSIRHFGTLD